MCVVSFSKFHEPDPHDLSETSRWHALSILVRLVWHDRFSRDMLATSSRGCQEDTTRTLLSWNFSFIVPKRVVIFGTSGHLRAARQRLHLTGKVRLLISVLYSDHRDVWNRYRVARGFEAVKVSNGVIPRNEKSRSRKRTPRGIFCCATPLKI